MTALTWRHRAACAGLASSAEDIFFDGTAEADRLALAVCATCRVRADCLAYAVTTGQEYGIWGGRTQQEIRRLVALERRGQSTGRAGWHRNALKTHCKHGHPFDAANTYYTPRGDRRCRTCMRLAHLAWAQGGGRRG
jgi:Transcription factor WhiB